jgi:hypothetical protein
MDDCIRHHIISFLQPDCDYSHIFDTSHFQSLERKRKLKFDASISTKKIENIFSDMLYIRFVNDSYDIYDMNRLKGMISDLFALIYEDEYTPNMYMDQYVMFKLFKLFDDDYYLKNMKFDYDEYFRNKKYYTIGKINKSKYLL